MHNFLVNFCLALDLRCKRHIHKASKDKVPKGGSFQWFLESIPVLMTRFWTLLSKLKTSDFYKINENRAWTSDENYD